MRKTNYYNETGLFKCDCAVNYRLSIIPNFERFVLFDSLYYYDGKIKLYGNSEELIDIFSGVIHQNRIEFSEFCEENIIDAIDKKKYFIGLYETSKLPGHKFSENINNYNTFIVYGHESDKFIAWCNTSLLGAESINIPASQLKSIICWNLSLTKNEQENKLLGYPVSSLEIISDAKAKTDAELADYIKRFYLTSREKCNFNILNYFYCTRMSDFTRHEYPGYQYQCAANIRIFKDIFSFHYLILNQICAYPKSVLEENKSIIKRLETVMSLYAKYIYTLDKKYIDRCFIHMENILNSIQKNKNAIMYVEIP